MARWSVPLVCLLAGGSLGLFLADPVLHGQNPPVNQVVPPVTGIPKELASYHPIVEKILPAVVSIETKFKTKAKKDQSSRGSNPLDNQDVPEDLRKFLQQFDQRQFQEDETPHFGFGSGVLADPKGVVLTAAHVVSDADQVEVTLMDGRKFTSHDIHADLKTDLAIVRLDAKAGPFPYLELGDSDAMQIGDRVLAVGAPFGLTGSVTSGIVSAKGRSGFRMNMYEDFIQTDAAINPGNSGGPLVNLEGKVIGINSAIKSRSGGFQGVGLAIPSNLARNVMEQLVATGTVHRGYLGVQIKDLTPEVAERLGLKDQTGVEVRDVFAKSPAGQAGVKAGDVITSIDGKPVKDGRQLQRVVAGLPLNKPVDINIFRDGKAQTLSVTIKEQPKEFGVAEEEPGTPQPRSRRQSITLDKIGIEVTDLTPELAQQLGFKEGVTGALITRVHEDSPAADAGLARGLVVVQANKKPVKSARALQQLLTGAAMDRGVLLQVQSSDGGTDYVVVKVQPQEKE